MSRLISHRFRGFAGEENTVAGLTAAMSRGVELLEFDIRVTLCGTPLIYHDEYALDIDIKDAGFETEIHSLVMTAGLGERVTYVSWVPEALYQIHDIAPTVPLCLSHWCQSPNEKTRKVHKVYEARNGRIPRRSTVTIHGERSGYFVDGRLQGELFDIIKATNGSVCVPQDMVSAELVQAYHAEAIEVSAFSYVDWNSIMAADKAMKIDQYFIDDKIVFDQMPR